MDAQPTVVFMHIGADVQLPTIMVRSVRRQNPGARIVQVADPASPQVEGVDEVARRPMTHRNVMLFRMEGFAAFPADGPTWFLDTDMICVRPLALLGDDDPEVAVCVREFDTEAIFNHQVQGADLSEYAGRPLGSVYPYVGCATYATDGRFWADCLADMRALDPKFFNWYGDQESIRNVVRSGRYRVGALPESCYACLPDREPPETEPVIFHYKGARKPLMLERATRDGLL